LVTVGVPLTLSFIFLLVVGIRSLRDADPGFARFENRASPPPPAGIYTYAAPTPIGRTASPSYFSPAVATSMVAAPGRSTLAETQYANLEALRETVHTAERYYRTGESPIRPVAPVAKSMSTRAMQAEAVSTL